MDARRRDDAGVRAARAENADDAMTATPARPPTANKGFLSWPVLDAPTIGAGAVGATITGHDPHAPRTLQLWRIDTGAARLLADTTSTHARRFDFGQLAVPNAGIHLVVTPTGEDPLARSPHFVRRDSIPPPQFMIEDVGHGEVAIHLLPALFEGSLLLQDDDGATIARLDLEAGALGLRGSGLVRIDADALTRPLHVVHQLRDGSRSERRNIARPPVGDRG
jgi:hypothetical protein